MSDIDHVSDDGSPDIRRHEDSTSRFRPLRLALVTPARNEAQFIELTIKSVVAQTVRPVKWVIVSDGSNDGTDEIVRKYASEHPWIELIRLPERMERHFAGKVHAFNAGYVRLSNVEYEVVGSLDADISFDKEYFSFLLHKLGEDPHLGMVGTPFKEDGSSTYDYRFVSIEHVSGACQVFRRECFEEIGGYTPVKEGCIDYIAVISARMKGWKTRTFTDKQCMHHRSMGTARHGILKAKFALGRKDYIVGNHPIWQMCRVAHQIFEKPFVVGALLLLSGYVWGAIHRLKRPVSDDLMAFHRHEQMTRLRKFFTSDLTGAKPETTVRQRRCNQQTP